MTDRSKDSVAAVLRADVRGRVTDLVTRFPAYPR